MPPLGRILLAAAVAGLVAAAVLWGAGLLWPAPLYDGQSGLHGPWVAAVRPG